MNNNHLEGTLNKAKGAVEEAAGKLANRPDWETKGQADQAKGSLQQAAGDVKDAASDAADHLKKAASR